MKPSTLVSNVYLERVLIPALISFMFVVFSIPGLCQTPELFEDKILINNMATPWSFTFIDNNEVLLTEKQGKLVRYVISTNTRTEITGLPSILLYDQGGLLDVALHPAFSSNRYVYLTYTVSASGGQTTALGRGMLVGNQLQNFTELFRAFPIRNSGSHFGSRIVFDRDNFLYMSIGDRGSQNEAQNRDSHLGKVLRFNDDGSVPSDNPLVGIPNTKPEIYSWGHRNIQGMAMNPATGDIYANEHGPKGGDELNLIRPNTNYGWPTVTFGINYDGSVISSDTTRPGMELPLTYWVPSIAPSGLAFIWSGQPESEADILIGALAGTHIHWLKMRDNKRVSSTRSMNGYARFRDVRQAPDGKLYAMTESPNRFVLLRSSVPILNVNVKTLLVGSKDTTNALGVFSNRTWTVNSDAPWCSVDKIQGQNNDSIRVNIDENTSIVERVATLRIRATALPTQIVTIRQEAAPAVLTTNTQQINFGGSDSAVTVQVRSNVSWAVRSEADWITVTPVSGLRDGNISVVVEENTSAESRTANVVIRGDSVADIVIRINQENLISSSALDEDLSESDWTVFPNPTDSKIYFRLKSNASEQYYVTILNYRGKAVMSAILLQMQSGIDVAHLPEGIYFLQITDKRNRSMITKKFVKK